jgi:hypothetical protein
MAKPAAPRASSSTRKKSSAPPQLVAVAREPSHEQIAERAYGLWLSRGGHGGDAVSDWVRAENELRADN